MKSNNTDKEVADQEVKEEQEKMENESQTNVEEKVTPVTPTASPTTA